MGGYVSQEAIKAITNKYMPTNQYMYNDCLEIIKDDQQLSSICVKQDRLDGLRLCLGQSLTEIIQKTKLFMVGSGAIGCELLKNFAMLSLGTAPQGSITLTDPDIIEVSNLSRQFLFREKHLRMSKSSVAGASAIQMNPLLKKKITSRLEKVCEESENIYCDKFLQSMTVVTNALDNIKARRYVDARCVSNRRPLIESGTLGSKGHVQVIIPHKTETYGQLQDPEEENQIPHCTLKMFPEETLHCVEWARDLFGKFFCLDPKSLQKVFEEYKTNGNIDNIDLKQLKDCIKLLQKQPSTFQDCLEKARKKFQKFFNNDISQLMFTYPLDKVTKDGKLFWSQPKRPPVNIPFCPEIETHSRFIVSFGCLLARVYQIEIPNENNSRQKEHEMGIAVLANNKPQKTFQPSQSKADQINDQVDEQAKDNQDSQTLEKEQDKEDLGLLRKTLITYLEQQKSKDIIVKADEFEKDNDQNQHIDFIWAMANIRASNYKLSAMDWMTVKIKAGRIIPALATTTAAIAGLQTIELVKLLNRVALQDTKNAFLNLAIPYCQLTEPGAVPKTMLTAKLSTNIWDRWEVNLKKEKLISLQDLFTYLSNTYQLLPKDLFQGTIPIFINALCSGNQRQTIMDKPILDLLEQEQEDQQYIDLTVTFTQLSKESQIAHENESVQESALITGVPIVRVIL